MKTTVLHLKRDSKQSRYWCFSLPAPYPGRKLDVMIRLKIPENSMDENCLVVNIKSELPIHNLIGKNINLNEINALFEKLDCLPENDIKKFSAILAANTYNVKEMLGILSCLDIY